MNLKLQSLLNFQENMVVSSFEVTLFLDKNSKSKTN